MPNLTYPVKCFVFVLVIEEEVATRSDSPSSDGACHSVKGMMG
jgi:hypothetical protein